MTGELIAASREGKNLSHTYLRRAPITTSPASPASSSGDGSSSTGTVGTADAAGAADTGGRESPPWDTGQPGRRGMQWVWGPRAPPLVGCPEPGGHAPSAASDADRAVPSWPRPLRPPAPPCPVPSQAPPPQARPAPSPPPSGSPRPGPASLRLAPPREPGGPGAARVPAVPGPREEGGGARGLRAQLEKRTCSVSTSWQ